MDQRTIMSLLRRTGLPAIICLIVLVGVVGVFGFLRPAHATHAKPAVVGGITVPASGTFAGNNADETFTYTYGLTIAVKTEAGGVNPKRPPARLRGPPSAPSVSPAARSIKGQPPSSVLHLRMMPLLTPCLTPEPSR